MFKPAFMISNLVSKDKVCLQTISMISKDIEDININYLTLSRAAYGFRGRGGGGQILPAAKI